ncbi:Conserved hypothetical protein [Bradyrhizobium sp. ORS 285]|uniref:hypothetical protein n=1 Tax=Bradyrhizobium sp. ORS 285 TaxID=115808 RepID=UPI0002407DDF|nr:hypothetical protein [Bradyrhizobium sp. ORS 285]CCD83850.1 conserved hypothetical protein [Bradyrhizobium sp. ORS 285]SMX59394.1 Conserved hypothetical protein [Bradyrhizobium sp. ORS 285]
MEFNRRNIIFGALPTDAVGAPPLPPLRPPPLHASPLRARPSGIRYRFNDGLYPSTVFDLLERSCWHVQSDATAHVIRHVGTGLTFADAQLRYDPFALELLHCFDNSPEPADDWQTTLVGWAAVNMGWNIKRQRPGASLVLSPSRRSPMESWVFDCADAPLLVTRPIDISRPLRPDIWLAA